MGIKFSLAGSRLLREEDQGGQGEVVGLEGGGGIFQSGGRTIFSNGDGIFKNYDKHVHVCQ